MDNELEQKINNLQMMERNIQSFTSQKQSFQAQQLELENALSELDKADGSVHKIIGSIMIASNKEDLKKDLTEKKEFVDIRLKSLEKQESQMREKATELQKEVMEQMQKGKQE